MLYSPTKVSMSIYRARLFAVLLVFAPIVVTATQTVDLSGNWEIQEEERSYVATLDANGNGTYTWQNGQITTTSFADGRLQGTWQQPGNDREGGFEILLSADRTRAEGKW